MTAVDLTPEYCDVNRWLNELVGLDTKIDVIEGDVTALPVPDASFDLIVSQHVQMNIEDKATLYAEARRVMRPGGRLTLLDIVAGPTSPSPSPSPGPTPPNSHLVTPDDLLRLLAGCDVTVFNDLTDFAVNAMTPVFDAPPDPLGLQLGHVPASGSR